MRIKNASAAGALLILALAICGCRTNFRPPSPSVLPASELRAMQTRTYDAMNPKTALKAVVDVLQDDGYIVDYGNAELGILHATKTAMPGGERDFTNGRQSFTEPDPQIQFEASRFEATVNLTEFGNQTKIRVSLQRYIPEVVGSYRVFGGDVPLVAPRAGTVVDAKTYQEFFAKLDRGLFLQKQGL